jgi:glutamine synthetase
LTSPRPVSASEAAAYATGPEVRPVPPGLTTYMLHEMREVEIDADVILSLLSEGGSHISADPRHAIKQVCEALRERDARLFMPRSQDSG